MPSNGTGDGAPAHIHRLSRSNLRDAATNALRELIISGQVPVGQPLRQDEVASRLGISRTPLREALRALVAEGLVRIDANNVAVVTTPSPRQLVETYEIREALEVLAGREAAVKSTPEHAAQVAHILQQMTGATDPDAWAELNARFHSAIYAITEKTQLTDLIDMLRNRAKLYVRILARETAPQRDADDAHEEMLRALENHDPDAMEDVIRRHLRSTTAVVAPHLESQPAETPA
jgi:DNA-binding GntR family transcriptional regulator